MTDKIVISEKRIPLSVLIALEAVAADVQLETQWIQNDGAFLLQISAFIE